MKVKPVKLRKVTQGQYLTEDSHYLIIKDDKGWSWQVSDGVQWIIKDKRKYKTRAWVVRCVQAEQNQNNQEQELWEG
jgi:hypothetical protein